MAVARDIQVELQFLSASARGRLTPASTGYRPQFFYRDEDWDAQHTYIGTDSAAPGQTVQAYLTFLSPELHVGHISVGMPFLIREGHKTVAFGTVLAIHDLEASARRSSAAGGHTGWGASAT